MQNTESLKRFIMNELAAGQVLQDLDENESLLETGILDSLAIIKLIAFIETEFLLKIEDEEMVPENFETLSHISRLISHKKAPSPAIE